MKLEDLVGLHKLTGVDTETEKLTYGWSRGESRNVINFVLDGITYTVTEDPGDGYRSTMEAIEVSKKKVMNMFKPVRVMCAMSTSRDEIILEFTDVKTGKIVLEVGTADYDDYYPNFVGCFTPENMWVNRNVKKENK
jgi:hypothetical protein